MSTKTFFWVGLTLLAVASIGYFNIRRDGAVSDAGIEDGATVVEGEENKEETDDNEPTEANVKVEQVPVASAPVPTSDKGNLPVPNLDREIAFENGVSEKQKEVIRGQVKTLTDTLIVDPDRFNEWTDLGLLLKSAGDYEWARQAWEYAGAIRPGNSLSFSNLGALYGYYLNKPLKAEENLLHAIENEPLFLNHYMRLTDFYLEVMEDKEKALRFLDRAISQYPEWTEIKDLRGYITR